MFTQGTKKDGEMFINNNEPKTCLVRHGLRSEARASLFGDPRLRCGWLLCAGRYTGATGGFSKPLRASDIGTSGLSSKGLHLTFSPSDSEV